MRQANGSLSVDYPKGTRKIVLERKKESMRSAWIGQLVAESLGGSIDSRKEIDQWLLQSLHSFLIVCRVGNTLVTTLKNIFSQLSQISKNH